VHPKYLNCPLILGDVTVLPFCEKTFDIIICSEVLEHLYAPSQALYEIVRVAKPGAKIIITVPNAFSLKILKLIIKRRLTGIKEILKSHKTGYYEETDFFGLPSHKYWWTKSFEAFIVRHGIIKEIQVTTVLDVIFPSIAGPWLKKIDKIISPIDERLRRVSPFGIQLFVVGIVE